MPFRCLDPQYRRELVRVYLTNVEGICRRFVEEKREMLQRLREDRTGFKAFWGSLDAKKKKLLAQEKGETILKVGSWPASTPHPRLRFHSVYAENMYESSWELGSLAVWPGPIWS